LTAKRALRPSRAQCRQKAAKAPEGPPKEVGKGPVQHRQKVSVKIASVAPRGRQPGKGGPLRL